MFAAVYTVGIPAYLARQIRRAVRVLDRNNPRHVRHFEEAERLRRGWRAARDALLRAGRRDDAEALRRGWRAAARRLEARGEGLVADAVADFDDARSALHCSYRRGRCSFRLVATLERLLLLLASALLSGAALRGWAGSAEEVEAWELPRLAAAAVVAAFFVVSVALQPFTSSLVSPHARPRSPPHTLRRHVRRAPVAARRMRAGQSARSPRARPQHSPRATSHSAAAARRR